MKFRITQFIFLLTTFLICCVIRHVYAGNGKTTLTPIRVPKGINYEWDFGISPDGAKVVYNDRYSLPEYLRPSVPLHVPNTGKKARIAIGWELYRLSIQPVITSDSNALAKPQVLLQEPIELVAQYEQPTWSPDGKWIAFYRWESEYYWEQERLKTREKNTGVYVIPATGGEISLLAPVNRIVGQRRMGLAGLSWSPDSKQLTFVSWQDGHSDIYIVSLDTKKVLLFTTDHKDNVNPSWSPDGKKIAFFSRRGVWLGDGYRVWVKPVDGGKAVLMTKNAFDVPIWSPDGKMVAYKGSTSFLGQHGVIVSSVNEQGKASGTPTVLQQPDLKIGKLIRWTVDGQILFFQHRIRPIHRDAEGALPSETHSGLGHYRKTSTLPTARIVSVKTNKLYTDLTAIPPIINGTIITIEYNADFKTVPEERLYRYRIYESANQQNSPYSPPTNVSSLRWQPDKPGIYTFEVQVVEVVDRILNYSQSDSVTLTVGPPWYLNPWISIPSGCIIFALSISLIVFGFRYYARHRESQRLEQEA